MFTKDEDNFWRLYFEQFLYVWYWENSAWNCGFLTTNFPPSMHPHADHQRSLISFVCIYIITVHTSPVGVCLKHRVANNVYNDYRVGRDVTFPGVWTFFIDVSRIYYDNVVVSSRWTMSFTLHCFLTLESEYFADDLTKNIERDEGGSAKKKITIESALPSSHF